MEDKNCDKDNFSDQVEIRSNRCNNFRKNIYISTLFFQNTVSGEFLSSLQIKFQRIHPIDPSRLFERPHIAIRTKLKGLNQIRY